jgi:lysophospholipase L1-like esterase
MTTQSGNMTTANKRGLSIRKKALFLAVLALLSFLMAEAASQFALRVAYGRRLTESERLNDYDSQLGWVNMKNRRAIDRYGPNKSATHNALGLRAAKEYTTAIPAGRYRITFLGDSFTYGVDVGDAGTFPSQLESLAPSIEAVNMAVAGYGIDQMYLSYIRDGGRLETNLLVLAVIEDDLRRMKLSAFLVQNPKPRVFLSGDRLIVANVPVPTWGLAARTGWIEELPNSLASVQILRSVYDLFVQNYDPLPVAERVFADLNNVAAQKHQRFAVVYLPAKTDVASDRQSLAAKQLQDTAARDHIPFFDLTSSFKEALTRESVPLFGKGVHYSEAGYKVVAKLLLNELKREFPDVRR